jgi:hypothetical protein
VKTVNPACIFRCGPKCCRILGSYSLKDPSHLCVRPFLGAITHEWNGQQSRLGLAQMIGPNLVGIGAIIP